jgi:hypothetical protein
VGRAFVARDSVPPLIAAMSVTPAAFAPGRFASLAIQVTVLGTAIVDPCARGKPLVRRAAQRTKSAAEEDRHGVEVHTVNVHASRNGFLRLGAADQDHAHRAAGRRSRGGWLNVRGLGWGAVAMCSVIKRTVTPWPTLYGNVRGRSAQEKRHGYLPAE